MEKQRKLFLSFLVGGLIIGLIAASQYIAYAYGYDPRLGWAMVRLPTVTLYFPGAFFIWIATLYNNGPQVINIAGLIFLGCMMGPFLVAVILTRTGSREVQQFARKAWGNKADAKKAGLVHKNPVGVIVGLSDSRDQIFSYDGPEHQLVAGASRAGKGAGHVIPTLLSWPGSVVVYDPKAECFDITGHFRGKFSHAFYINFTLRDSAAFNPLGEVRRGDNEVADVQNIVQILSDPGGVKDSPNFFDISASSLLTGIVLHQLYTAPDEEKNLAAVRTRMMSFNSLLADMASTAHRFKADRTAADGLARDERGDLIPEPHPEVQGIATQYKEMDAKLKSNLAATVMSYLDVFADPIVAEKTSRSDFQIGDLMCSGAPVSCYLQTPPSDAARLKPLTRLFLSQMAKSLMTEQDHDAQGRKKKHKLLFEIDEFPSLGRLGFFSDNLRVMAGYGIKAHIIVQSFKDIMASYGRDNTIVDNCHITVAFATADDDTAAKVSAMAGKAVEYRMSESRSSNGSQLFAGSRSRSYGEQERNIISPGDVRQLPYDEQLIFVTSSKPFRSKKIRYWEDAPFKDRATNIRKGEKGPNQGAHLDVPNPGGASNPWYGVRAAGVVETVGYSPVTDRLNRSEAAEDAAALAITLNIDPSAFESDDFD